jgi:hypothetical protein
MARSIVFEGRKIIVPDDATDSEIEEIINAAAPASEPAPKFTPEQLAAHKRASVKSMTRAENPTLATAADVLAGMTNIPRHVLSSISPQLAEKLFSMEAVDKESGGYLTGQILDPYAMAAGGTAANLAIKSAKTIPKIGTAVASRPVVQGMLGGGAAGAAVGGLSEDQDAATGAGFGAALGGFLPVVGKTVGGLWDRLSGTAPAIRAKQILSDVYGPSIGAARQAWQQAPADVSATQAAGMLGCTRGAALGERAAQADSQYFYDLAQAQAQARRNEIAKLAGGETQTAALAAQKQSKKALNAATTPLRETELSAANIAGEVTRKLEPKIAQKQASMEQALQNTGRAFADENTTRQALLQKLNSKTPGWVKPETIAELEANVLKQRSAVGDLNAMKWQRQDERDFLMRQLDSLSDYGLKPINTDTILNQIETRLADPKLAGNSIASKAMEDVANEIAVWTARNGGIIDAQALYSIRKNAVNAAIQRQLSGASPKAQQKAAAGVLDAINPLIDDAITSAGGTGWKNYLTEYAEGAKLIDRQKLGAEALRLLDSNPKGFIKLAQGNDPKTVRKIFQSESDVVAAMREGYVPLRRVADEMQMDQQIKERAAAGRTELHKMLADKAAKFWMPRLISWKFAIAKETGDLIESNLNQKTLNKVYYGMRSGKNAEEIMSAIPAKERIPFLNLLYSGKGTPATMGVVQTTGEEQQ